MTIFADPIKELITRAEAYCRDHDIKESKFGRECLRDPNLLDDLRNGRSPTIRTIKKIEAFLEKPRVTT